MRTSLGRYRPFVVAVAAAALIVWLPLSRPTAPGAASLRSETNRQATPTPDGSTSATPAALSQQVFQLLPFQCSISVRELKESLLVEAPTAQTSFSATAATALRLLG